MIYQINFQNKEKKEDGVPIVAQQKWTWLVSMRFAGLISDLTQWVKDPILLWLWSWPAAAAPIQPLAWELSYAMGVALKVKKKKRKKEEIKYSGISSWVSCTVEFKIKSISLVQRCFIL